MISDTYRILTRRSGFAENCDVSATLAQRKDYRGTQVRQPIPRYQYTKTWTEDTKPPSIRHRRRLIVGSRLRKSPPRCQAIRYR
jgi:hypothetical protein